MNAQIEHLTPKQDKALTALLSADTVKDAAKAAGVNEATLWRWLQAPLFQQHYRSLRRQLVEAAVAQLQRDCTTAVRVLRQIAEDIQAPASARVTAARAIIDQSVAAVELMDIQERVERLEALLAAAAQGKQKERR